MADIIKIKLGANVYNVKDASAARKNVYYGTCTTAANTYKKVATVETFPLDSNGLPLVGTLVAIKYSNTNTYKTEGQTYQLNVNNTGDFPMYYNNAALATSTSANTLVAGYKNRHIYYMFNGSQWVWVTSSYDANTTYSGMTQAEVDAGTSTTNRLISPKLLRDNFYTEGECDANFVTSVSYDSTSKKIQYTKNSVATDVVTLSDVATSGSYNDLTDKPTIPAAQVQSDWNATEGMGVILNKPTIPTVPTNVSSFTNDAGYLTSHQDISGKADKSEMSVSTSSDTTTITLKSGTSATVINQHNIVLGKLLNGNFYSGVYVSQLGDWHFSDTAETGNSKKLYVDIVNKRLYEYEGSYVSITSDFVTLDLYDNDIQDIWDNLVPQTRTINSKALSDDITLTASDVNAQEVLVSGTNIKTINSQSLLGEGNLTIASGSDGVGIASVVQTTTSNTSGGNNIITVTKTDGSSSTFTVKNGVDGANGVSLGEIALTQETGDSTSSVMSQAAVTESIEQSIQSTKSRQVVDPTKAIYTTITADSNATSMNTYLFDEICKLDVVYRVAYGWNSVNYYSSGNLCSIYIDSNNFIRWRVDSYACYAEIKVNGTYLLQNSHTINSGSPQLNSRTQIAAVIDLIQNKMIIYGVNSGSMSIIYSYDISSYDISSFSGKQAKIITTIFSYNRSYYGVYVRVNKFLGLEDDLTRTIYASGYNAFPAYQKAPQFGYNNLINGLTLGGTVTQTITSTHKIISATSASGYFALAPKTSKSVSYPNLFWTLNIKLLSGSISIGRSAASVIGGVYIYDSNMNQVSTIAQNTTYLMLVGALTRETAYAFSYALSVSGTFELEVWNPNLFNIQTQNICVDTWDGEYFTGTIPFKASPMFASTTAVGSIQISNGNIQMWNGSVWKQINNS